MRAIATTGFTLHPWQSRAVDAWVTGDGRPYHGTLEIVTGGGKTLIALACAARVATRHPDLRLAVVVPTEALARQWQEVISSHTNLSRDEVGLLGGGGGDSLARKRALVCVLNSAAKRLPEDARNCQSLMLIVDECHRAGAPTFSRVLDTPSLYRLGLSATPDREELDEDGEPIAYDEQVVGRELGDVVVRFSLRDARNAGWLPRYSLNHHGVSLGPDERSKYESLGRRIDEAADELRSLGAETSRARQLVQRSQASAQLGEAARTWLRLTADRKDLLYRAASRHDVAVQIVTDAFERQPRPPRAILFHERVDQAEALYSALQAALPAIRVAIEHSQLSDRARRQALESFRTGESPVLVSVKSLIEGIDVPEADIGISVASTSSVRQRVQSLGRVLRGAAALEGADKTSTMHLIYVRDSVDELIYSKADWSDLTGAELNHYWIWPPDGPPATAPGPPMSPLPTEDQAWTELGREVSDKPVPWHGVVVGQEYSVDTTGSVRNAFGRLIANSQGAGRMVEKVRGRAGGRFRVTPEHLLVLVWLADADGAVPYLAGRLSEPFRTRDEGSLDSLSMKRLSAGDIYTGPADKGLGTYKLGQRSGGIIERRVHKGKEVALTTGSTSPEREADAKRVLAAWRSLGVPGMTFFVNSAGHAWYEQAGNRRFLAEVTHGFIFPGTPPQE
jgi:superfamily II DNA or RNA helicase